MTTIARTAAHAICGTSRRGSLNSVAVDPIRAIHLAPDETAQQSNTITRPELFDFRLTPSDVFDVAVKLRADSPFARKFPDIRSKSLFILFANRGAFARAHGRG